MNNKENRELASACRRKKGNRESPSVREWGKKTVLIKKRVSNHEENRYGRSVCFTLRKTVGEKACVDT